ncbi:hypothetical protein [Emticicia sp. 17c]|uniref:hypothetical protein n=1 Tax=Emticicia sp. 17c TaxID=3127704 RepID=UPI00301B982A
MKNNVRLMAITLGLGMSISAFAQKDNVGIGTTKPDQSAILDLNSSSKGLLMPRMSLQQRNAIQSPAKGLIVYQTDFLSGFYFYDGNDWKPLTNTKDNAIAGDPNDWSLNGNSNATSDSFIGTPIGTSTDIPINFKLGGVTAGKISNTSNFFLGYQAGNTGGGTGTTNLGVGYMTLKSLTTGSANTAIGYSAISKTTTGQFNLAIGGSSLTANTTGTGNVGLGHATLFTNTTGGNNIAIGKDALYNSNGTGNTAIGASSLVLLTGGNNNTALGYQAGLNTTGSGNIFLGYQSGQLETTSNKLYIANSNTANPLIKGEFDNKNLKINLGATKSTTVGFLAVGNFDASFAMPTNNAYRLIVQDGIITEKVKVALKGTADWADYVFEPSYQLLPLEKVESFVKENKHLPNVPSAEEMSKNGLDVTQTSAKLMEKIEELTLYMIEMNKEIKALKAENANLKKEIEKK